MYLAVVIIDFSAARSSVRMTALVPEKIKEDFIAAMTRGERHVILLLKELRRQPSNVPSGGET